MKLDALNGLMELLDGDEDGRVTFEEFRKIFDERDLFRTSQRVEKIEDVFQSLLIFNSFIIIFNSKSA